MDIFSEIIFYLLVIWVWINFRFWEDLIVLFRGDLSGILRVNICVFVLVYEVFLYFFWFLYWIVLRYVGKIVI